ncbi:MAG TPA: ABC transporter ATP-binding protein [Rhizobiaceae bacterium]|nr:ABC transporter ATP-binding protein [Rhizobiaceae bacterium]
MSGLSIRKLYKAFGAVTAVKGVDLEIGEGELVVLLGPSGCGKTTTLRCIAGLEDITDGSISIGDRVVSEKGRSLPPERREIGMVFQSYAIWPHMTVAENVAFGLKLKNLPKSEIESRVRSALELVGLTGYSSRHVSQLSGGQQQRVALARAMALEPRILLFDEPLSNLDAKLREKMRFELRQIQQRLGITSVYVTHDQQEAMVIADRIVLMRNGVIEQMGAPEDLYHRPKTLFAAEFVGLANIYSGEARGGEVRIANGPVLKSSGGASGPVDVVFRPEQVRVSSEQPADATNALRATVKESYFLGNIEDLILTVEGIDIRTQLSPAEHRTSGSSLWISIPPEAIILLPRGGQMEKAA